MLVEIHGAGFHNKGSELMLNAVVNELRCLLPEFEAAIDPTYGSYKSRCELSLYQIVPPRSHVGTPGFVRRFRKQRLFSSTCGANLLSALGMPLDLYGAVKISDIRGFVDIAGFAYTDEWGARPTEDFARLTTYYKSKGVPVILMPQAFGPFHSPETKSAFQVVLENATLVFARDQQSYDYILELASEPMKITKAPDITFFYPHSSQSLLTYKPDASYACVVPNIRILDKSKQKWGDKYHLIMARIIRELRRRGVQVRLVVHDSTGEDLTLARCLCEDLSDPGVILVEEDDPIALKKLISDSLMVVGSRYHSMVAALSQRVPAVAIGWSHKYEMLFRDFGLEGLVFSSPQAPVEEIVGRVAELAEPDANCSCRYKISRHLQDMHAANRKMWAMVADTLAGRSA